MGDMADYYGSDRIGDNEAATAESRELAIIPQQVTDGPSYAGGFDGMATEPFDEKTRAVLGAPVDETEVLIRPDGIVYMPGVWYRRRLLLAFGAGGWALAPRSEAKTLGNLVVYHGALFCLKRYVSEAVGECLYQSGNNNMTHAQALEGSRTDCLTRCCKDLGLGSELWDKAWIEAWKRRWATSYKEVKNGKERWLWKKVGTPTAAEAPTTTGEPAPPPRQRPAPVEEPPMALEDFLAKCEAAVEFFGPDKFAEALAIYRVKTYKEVPENMRNKFVGYLRKMKRT